MATEVACLTIQLGLKARQMTKSLARRLDIFASSEVLFLVVLASCAQLGCASGIEPRFFTWPQAVNQPLADVFDRTGSFQAVVERRYDGELEARLLGRVEATYPLFPDSIILQGFEQPDADSEPRWWSSEVDGLRIPVAVTRPAVDYYLDLIRALQKGNSTRPEEIRQQSARLDYSAEIAPAAAMLENPGNREETANKFIVRLEMSWKSDCGPRCGLQFTRTRTAVITRSGDVLEILEDPLAPTFID